MRNLHVALLGEFSVTLNSQVITDFSYDKVRALLAYLITESGQPHRRDKLIGLLWPGYAENRARQSLSQALSTLRGLIGDRSDDDDFIQATRQSLSFVGQTTYSLDIDDFLSHLSAAQLHPHARIAECETCLTHLEKATALYRGDFLESLRVDDSIAFDEWAILRREAFRRQMLDALDQLGYAYLSRKNTTRALETARRQLELDPWRETAHRQVMQALVMDGQRAEALAQYEECRDLLAAELQVEPEDVTTALRDSILDGTFPSTQGALFPGVMPPAPGTPPFKGLRYFDVEDAPLFFGREALVTRIIERLDNGAHFLAIVGASGSGKSSLVRAGIVAALLPADTWNIHIITPTADPVASLCRMLCGNLDKADSLEHLRVAMEANPQILLQHMLANTHDSQKALIVVDQFEELFTLCQNPAQRQAFLDNLLTAVGDVSVVITLRADYYHHCAEHELLRQAVESQQIYIGSMVYEELQQAIELPARHAQWSFEPGLVELMLKDVGATAHRSPEPGALPLLSHALLETWKRREGRILTLNGYAEAGGVRGAIALSAETVYQAFAPNQQRIARMIFLRLTEFGDMELNPDSALYTRRRATLLEMQPSPDMESAIQTVLDILAGARLITVQRDAVEVAHEALIREWPTLRAWLETDMERLRTHRHLTEAAQAWMDGGWDTGDLLRGARLAQVEEWSNEAHQELNALEREFIEASITEMEHAEAQREAQRQRALANAQHVADLQQRRAEERGRLLRWIGLAAVLLLIAAIVAGVLGTGYRNASNENANLAEQNAEVAAQNAEVAATARAAEAEALTAQEREADQRAEAERLGQEATAQRDAAQEQARLNLAMSLAGQANLHQEKNSDLALLLALEANTIEDSALTRGAIMTALDHSPGQVQYIEESSNAIYSLALSPDATILASINWEEVLLWNLALEQRIPVVLTGDSHVQDIAFARDKRYLVVLRKAQDVTPHVVFYDMTPDYNAKPVSTLFIPQYSGGIESYLDISPDGQYLVVSGCAEPVTYANGWVFCKQGGGATLWDISGLWESSISPAVELKAIEFDGDGEAYDIAFSPDGEAIAMGGCAGYDGSVCQQGFTLLWNHVQDTIIDIDDNTFSNDAIVLTDALAFTPDGTQLASGGCSEFDTSEVCVLGHADLWELDTYTSIASYTIDGENGVQSLAISPNGQYIAIGSSDTIRLWEPAANALLGNPMIGHTGHVMALAFSADGQSLYSGGQDWQIGVWDLTLRGGIGERIAKSLPAFHLDYAPDGRQIAVGTVGGVQIRNANNGAIEHTLALERSDFMVWDVDYNPNGSLLASAGYSDGAVMLWDVETQSRTGEAVIPSPGDSVYSVEFSPDGTLLASSGDGADIVLWDVDSLVANTPISRTLVGHTHGGNPQITFSPDGSFLASAGHDKTARLWDITTGEQIGDALDADEGFLLTVAFSPDGKILATGGQDTVVRLWDVATQAHLADLKGHNQFIWRMAFTPDGDTLVSFDAWGIVRLWDMRDPAHPGQPIGATMRGHEEWAWGLTLSPDGKTAITSARSGELVRWQLDPAVWRERACEIVVRNLTAEEWETYLPGEIYRETCP